MKLIPKIVLALVAAGSCGLAASQTYSSQEDADRRMRNREEAIANHERMQSGGTMQSRSGTMIRDDESHHGMARENIRDAAHAGANTVRSGTHKAASKTRSFTHRQVNKLRNFGERQQRKYPNTANSETNKSGTALGK